MVRFSSLFGLIWVDVLFQEQVHFPQKLQAFEIQRDVPFGIGSMFKDHSREDFIISDKEVSKQVRVLHLILSLEYNSLFWRQKKVLDLLVGEVNVSDFVVFPNAQWSLFEFLLKVDLQLLNETLYDCRLGKLELNH